ncbi:MAG: glycosyltransferase [Pleurocapsa minor HA4230-MV1]|jgi:glycosyltransferase involved in cell wall biosynthesis|nr:glycosyltransferase [Pleurocapsa minor HA4230-MV1]
MSETTPPTKLSGLFIVWKKYQRRPEVLASLLNCELKFLPHLFPSKYLRPLDYLFKLAVNIKDILLKRPDFAIAQCPPTFSALPALITKTPYLIDAHNPLFQVKMWQKLPISQTILSNSLGIIVHNTEMFELVKGMYPATKLFTISDPIKAIAPSCPPKRLEKQILVIASFDPWDEPVELLIDSMKKLTEYNFVITADANKLNAATASSLQQLNNVSLTGFLATEDYHQVLCSSLAALVLTTSDATQPSGACEALSSDTQLVISRTSLTEKLFGEWAVLVDNNPQAIAQAIRSLSVQELDLAAYRQKWNMSVQQEITRLSKFIEQQHHKK